MKTSTKYLKFFLNLLLTVAGIVLAIYLGGKLLIFFMPLVIGWIIAMIANPLVRFLERKLKMVRKHSSMIIIIGVLALLVLAGYFAVSRAIVQAGSLAEQLPQIYASVSQDFKEAGEKLQGIYSKLPESIQTSLSEFGQDAGDRISRVISESGKPTVAAAGNIAKNLPTIFVMVIFSILFAYFFIAERDRILEAARKKVPLVVQEKWRMVLNSFSRAFGGYFKAQFKIMGVVFLILFAGFLILGIHFAVLLAFLIAFLDMLPFFGTGTALWPWALFSFLSGDTRRAIGLLIIYAVSQIVRQVIQPKLVGDSVGINPLLALFLMFIGFRIRGVLGMIIAIPLGLVLINLYQSGVFDEIIAGFRMIAHDLHHFLKGDEPKKTPVSAPPQDKDS